MGACGMIRHDCKRLSMLIADIDFYNYADSLRLKFGENGGTGQVLASILSELVDHGVISIDEDKAKQTYG
jgi:hypothetical protein